MYIKAFIQFPLNWATFDHFFPQTIFSRYSFSISKFHQIKMMDVVKPKSLYSAYHIFDLDQKIFFATLLPGPGTVYLHIWSTLHCPPARGGPLLVTWKYAENETFMSKVTKVVADRFLFSQNISRPFIWRRSGTGPCLRWAENGDTFTQQPQQPFKHTSKWRYLHAFDYNYTYLDHRERCWENW